LNLHDFDLRIDFYADPVGRLSRFVGPAPDALEPEMDWIYAAGQLVATVYHEWVLPEGSSPETTVTTPAAPESRPNPGSIELGIKQPTPDDSAIEPLGPIGDDPGPVHIQPNPGIGGGGGPDPPDPDPEPVSLIRWYVPDHRGSTLMVLDEQGEVLATYEYFPFGGLKSYTGTMDLEGVYQGALRDPETNLYDLGARHHSPDLARFMVPDVVWPDLRLPSRWNLYLYSSNDPVNLIDLLGYATKTKNGGVNYLRNIDLYDDPRGWRAAVEVGVNAAGGMVSDYLDLDTIADGCAVAGDSTNSVGKRVLAGAKVVGTTAMNVCGGVIIKRTLGGLWRGARNLLRFDDAVETGAKVAGHVDEVSSVRTVRRNARRVGRAPEFYGGRITESGFLRHADEYLGPGYKEVSPGRYLSADGMRQVRYGAHEVRSARHHAHFEAYDAPGGHVIENTVVDIIPDPR
jgi:RHS repeat-associated protein